MTGIEIVVDSGMKFGELDRTNNCSKAGPLSNSHIVGEGTEFFGAFSNRAILSSYREGGDQMGVFVTGASGFIGSAVVKELINAGHEMTGLARSKKSGAALSAMGAGVQIGSVEDVESLRKGAASANAVVHLAFFHKLSHASLPTCLRILFGGNPSGLASRFAAAAVEVEKRAVEALCGSLTGSDRALVIAFPTLALTPGRLAMEDDSPDRNSPGGGRAASEEAALELASRGSRAPVVRLPPAVHDRQRQGIAARMIALARQEGVSAYVRSENRWPAVHRLDAARLFRSALETGSAGARRHALAEEGVPVKTIPECIGQRLGVPAASMSPQGAAKHFGWLSPFLSADNLTSSQLTHERLGWRPTQPSLISTSEKSFRLDPPNLKPSVRPRAPSPN